MKATPFVAVPCVASLIWLLAAAPATAESAGPVEHRTEVTVLFGASLLSVEDESELPIPLPGVRELEAFFPLGRAVLPIPFDVSQRSRLGGSFLQGLEVSRRVARRGWIEARFLIAPTHNLRHQVGFRCPPGLCDIPVPVPVPDPVPVPVPILTDGFGVDERVTVYHAGLGLAYELLRGEVRPYLSLGVGTVTYDMPHRNETDFTFDVGAGARLGLTDRLGVRLEVADRITPDHFLSGDTEHDVHVRAGLVFRLP